MDYEKAYQLYKDIGQAKKFEDSPDFHRYAYNKKRETDFKQEQIRHEVEFREDNQQREARNKRRLEELTYCLNAGISPSGEGLNRLLSED
jgi:uncharacterized Fe-S cluster-containing protein